jgi:hypothetical protein
MNKIILKKDLHNINMDCEYNFGQFFFILTSLIPCGFILSALIVSKFIWLPWTEKLNSLPEYEIPYINQDIITDEDIENLNDNKDYTNLKEKRIIEETPNGNIFLRYNHENEGFEYWCDKKLSYKILETCARKYVKRFHSVDLYIERVDMIKEYIEKKGKEKEKERKIEEEKEKARKEGKEVEDIFATFKKYNKGDGNTTIINRKEIPTAEKANKYIHKGKFKESPEFMKKKKEIKKMNWSSWSDDIHGIQGEDF